MCQSGTRRASTAFAHDSGAPLGVAPRSSALLWCGVVWPCSPCSRPGRKNFSAREPAIPAGSLAKSILRLLPLPPPSLSPSPTASHMTLTSLRPVQSLCPSLRVMDSPDAPPIVNLLCLASDVQVFRIAAGSGHDHSCSNVLFPELSPHGSDRSGVRRQCQKPPRSASCRRVPYTFAPRTLPVSPYGCF